MSMRTNDVFQRHEPCHACGSRNNLARYKSGSAYCFGCGYYEGSKRPLFSFDDMPSDDEPDRKAVKLPDNCTTAFSQEVLEWVKQYGLSTIELIKAGCLYNSYWDQLVFPFYDGDRRLVLYQARNFEVLRRQQRKYFTQGDVAQVLPIYQCNSRSRTLVLVEDCVSAIKLSRYCDAMPCLSSNLPKAKLMRLRVLYDSLIIWLDGNMYDNAMKLAKQAELLGFSASAVYTVEDPKSVDDTEIKDIINACTGLTQ